MLYGKPSQEKTQLEGETTSLSFYVWKYGYRYKEVILVAHRLLQSMNLLNILYFLYLLAIVAEIWNKILSKEWNVSSSYWSGYNTT